MDLEFPQKTSFILFPETASLNRFILLPNKEAAKNFFEKVFPHNTNCVVISADGAFPENQKLREACIDILAKNDKVLVAVFNPESLVKVKVVSDRVLLLDDFICQDHRSEKEDRELGFELNEEKLSAFIETFFRQWEKISSDGNYSFQYKESVQINWRFGWPLKLLTGSSS